MSVHFVPDWRQGNPYLSLLASALGDAGVKVSFGRFPASSWPILRLWWDTRGTSVLHIHWINPLLPAFWGAGKAWKVCVQLVRLALEVLAVRALGRTVVWTVHNRLSHESADPAVEVRVRRVLARTCTRLIFHSPQARAEVERLLGMPLEHRAHIQPHGHYIGVYPANTEREWALRNRLGIADSELTVLFFGAVRPYKGLQDLLEAFRDVDTSHLRLVIAGRPFDAALEAQVLAAARLDRRLSPMLEFIPESDVHSLFSVADAVVIPFSRTLTSGSVILAMSMGRAIVLPASARVLGLPDSEGLIYYTDLLQTLRSLGELSVDTLRRMGTANEQAIREWDWKRIGEELARAYRTRAGR
jgi:glycosyltransferase involved in cell wall biosynthesis